MTEGVRAGIAARTTRHSEASPVNSLPRTVIRGESIRSLSNPLSAITDWLNCTFEMADNTSVIDDFFHNLSLIIGKRFRNLVELNRGHNGWKRSYDIADTGGLFAIGGQNDRAFLSFTGSTCSLVPSDKWEELMHFLAGDYQARITRWDGAVDDFAGIHSVDWAVQQYKSGKFNTGGKLPSCNQHGNWIKPDGRGRTFEVGRRKNGKLLRIYEKGKQLGDPKNLWVRWELELHNKDREVPWDVLIRPGDYVAGAYKATNWISETACRVKTYKKTHTISYNSLVQHATRAYGPLVNVMQQTEGSAEKVVQKLLRAGVPKRLQIEEPPEVSE